MTDDKPVTITIPGWAKQLAILAVAAAGVLVSVFGWLDNRYAPAGLKSSVDKLPKAEEIAVLKTSVEHDRKSLERIEGKLDQLVLLSLRSVQAPGPAQAAPPNPDDMRQQVRIHDKLDYLLIQHLRRVYDRVQEAEERRKRRGPA